MALHAYRYPEHLPLQLGGGYKNYPFKSKLCKDAAPHCYHEVWTAHPAPSHADCAALANVQTFFGFGPDKSDAKTNKVFKNPDDVNSNCGIALWVDPDLDAALEVSFTTREIADAAEEINDFCFGESPVKPDRELASKRPELEWNVGACNMHGYSVFVSSRDGFTSKVSVATVDGAGNPVTSDVTRTLKKRARETAAA